MDDDRGTRALSAISGEQSGSGSTESQIATDSQAGFEEDENALVLDPNRSERQYWRDVRNSVEREVWRPGNRVFAR